MPEREGFRWKRGRWQPSKRQRQVLQAVSEGHTNAEIAEALGISVAGVRWQISELLGETGLEDRHALGDWWHEHQDSHRAVGALPLLALLRRHNLRWPAIAAAAIATAALTAVILLPRSSTDRGDLPLPSTALDVGDDALTATPQPQAGDLSNVNAVVLQWLHWSETGGAWNSQIMRGGETTAPKPLPLGYGGTPLLSPNGRLIAHVDRGSGEMTVYDLADWRLVLKAQTAPDLVPQYWSIDSSQVYGWREYCAEPADRGVCPTGLERDLWRVDLERGNAERIASFDFSVIDLVIPPERDAPRAYVLGVSTDVCCAINPAGDPFIAVVDLERGEVTNRIPLPGLTAGQVDPTLIGQTYEGDGGSFWPDLEISPDGARLYVVEASDDAVIEINIETLATERVELHEKRSALSSFGDWLQSQLVDVAEAKGGAAYHRDTAITPDGRYLIIGGTHTEEVTLKDDSQFFEDRPSGVLVVDTKDMTIAHREAEAAWFKLSPNGRWLLMYGSYYDSTLGQDPNGGVVVAFGLKVFDLTTMKQTAQLWPGEAVEPEVFSADNRHVYVTSEGPGALPARLAGTGCSADCFGLNLLDLENSQIVWQGRLADDQNILDFPAAGR